MSANMNKRKKRESSTDYADYRRLFKRNLREGIEEWKKKRIEKRKAKIRKPRMNANKN